MKVQLLRKGSKGIEGTYENAKHHAQATLPIITQLKSIIERLGLENDFTWEQGHNLHIISNNFGKLAFRPFRNEQKHWGIQVLTKTSRNRDSETPIFNLTTTKDVYFFEEFLIGFITQEQNLYGKLDESNELEEND